MRVTPVRSYSAQAQNPIYSTLNQTTSKVDDKVIDAKALNGNPVATLNKNDIFVQGQYCSFDDNFADYWECKEEQGEFEDWARHSDLTNLENTAVCEAPHIMFQA